MNNLIKTVDFEKIAKSLFAAHPAIERYFFSSDGQAFEQEHNAESHALKLGNQVVTDVYRPELSNNEIERLRAEYASEKQAGFEASFSRANPELALLIKQNARSPRG